MIFLKNDYGMGAHPKVLQALIETNKVNSDGYGEDEFTEEAAALIRELTKCPGLEVHFTMAGTQTNLCGLSSILKPHEAVISADTGHICVHEVGAVEATGHKVIHIPTADGKLIPQHIHDTMAIHEDYHWVKPKAIYISNLTETGVFYKKAELEALRNVCDEYGLYIYFDGARLPMALTLPENDITLEDLPKYCDVFYLGGTKCGILFGEALCYVNPDLQNDVKYMLKQRGAVLAKGRLLGVQFKALLSDNLYFEIGKHCNDMAKRLVDGLRAKGYTFDCPPCSNLVFPIFSNEMVEKLSKEVMFEGWRKFDNGTSAIRFVTSWGTTEEEIDALLALV